MLEASNKHKNQIEEEKKENPYKILIVDDDVDIQDTLSDILKQEGFKTKTVETGKEAIDACQKEPFDVALIDIKLPDMDGTELLEMLKKLEPSLIRIIVTGYPSMENAVQSLNLGADGYVVKPFKPVRLLEQIKEQLGRRRKTQWENLLMKTGLSEYEAKVYLSLTLEGVSEAGKLSILSGVPRPKTYTSLKKLIQMGFVLEIPGEPQRFSALPPSGSLCNFVQSWKKELSEQAIALVELENTIAMLESIHQEKQDSNHSALKREEIWSVKEGEEIKRITREILSKAKCTVWLLTTETGLFQFYKKFGKVLDDLTDIGVRVRIKVPVESSNTGFVRELRNEFKVENTQVSVPLFLLIVDGNALILTNLKSGDSTESSEKDFALFSQSGTLTSFISNLMGFASDEV
jgi:sugar-specific transcriptional regulator TrmB/CheY-like chemotaxis protein